MKNISKKSIKYLLILSLIANIIQYYFRRNYLQDETDLKIFIITHKDFQNFRHNPVYTIVANDRTQLTKKYNLKIIFADKSNLYKMKRAYCEMSQLYYIYSLYKKGEITSKYIGFNHYRRYFNFTDNIPDIDEIFQNYDVILNDPFYERDGMKKQYCTYHICDKYEEILDIIKDIKPDYYETAIKPIYNIYYCNLFIMKKHDFFRYCEFVFDILFEFDRRNNFTKDDDVINYLRKNYKNIDYDRQSRLQAFLSERIGNIFFYHNFKKIKTFNFGNFIDNGKKVQLFENKKTKEKENNSLKPKLIYLSTKINIILLVIILFIILIQNSDSKNFNNPNKSRRYRKSV